MRAWIAESDDPFVSRHAKLREVTTHVVGPMCHVLWAWTTGDAVGPNMMTRNSYLLNMGYVMERAPVKPERAILEANMGGDKKPSYQYFHSGHGKTVIAECTLTDEAIARILRTTAEDLEALAWAGTHGAVASGMQSVAFTPASAIAAVFTATGQDIGMVGTSSMAHGTGRRVDGGFHCSIRFPGLEVGTVGGGTTLPSAHDWLGAHGLRRPRARSTASRRSSPPPRSRSRSRPPPRWRAPAPRTSSARTTSAAAFADPAEGSRPGPKPAISSERESPHLLRIVAVGTVLIALMIAVKDHRLLQRAHLVGYCSTFAQAADGSEWRSCVPGRLSGRPGLEFNSCTDYGRTRQRGDLELPGGAGRQGAPRMRRAARRRPFVFT